MRWRRERYVRVDSTNDLVLARARAGEAEGLVVIAERQSRGRGRHGRVWQSPPGNLYMSVLLRPSRPRGELGSLSLVVGLAAREGVAAATAGRIRPRLKWPNDLLVGDAKLGGILLEAAPTDGEGTAVAAGIGLNVARRPDLPQRPATVLAEWVAERPSPESLAERIVAALGVLYGTWNAHGFEALRERWLAAAHGLGEEVQLRLGERLVRGRFLDVDARGRLELGEAPGVRRLYDAGELFFASDPVPALADRGERG